METNQVVIPLSKGKTFLTILGCICFVALGAWVWAIADHQQYDPLLVRFAMIAGWIFFGLVGLYACYKFFDRKPGLVVDGEGIVDNSSGVSAGRIRWEEITDIGALKVQSTRFLTIHVTDPEKFIRRGNFVQRALNAASVKMTGTPITISSNALQMNFSELQTLLTGALEAYRASRPPKAN